jgi:purine-nucleoside phosphorylase
MLVLDQEANQRAEAKEFLRSSGAPEPSIGVVLGSGLGRFVERLSAPLVVPYARIPNMPTSSVAGHAGNLCFGQIGGANVVCMQGRVHCYEGHPLSRVVFGVRLLAELGCTTLLLTNAAGGIAADLRVGDLMSISDHLNLTGGNPLVGSPSLGRPRFFDMTSAYDPGLRALCETAARSSSIALKHGIYAALLGPSYETPAEIRMLRALGADAVGMSTVPEVIALRELGVRVAAVSLITNLAAGISSAPLDHAEVQATAEQAANSFGDLLSSWIGLIRAQGES